MQRSNQSSTRFKFDRPRSPARPGDTRPALSNLQTRPGQPSPRPKPFAPLGRGAAPKRCALAPARGRRKGRLSGPRRPGTAQVRVAYTANLFKTEKDFVMQVHIIS